VKREGSAAMSKRGTIGERENKVRQGSLMPIRACTDGRPRLQEYAVRRIASTLALSGRIAPGIGQSRPERGRGLGGVGSLRRGGVIGAGEQMTTDGGEGISEGRLGFGIPGGLTGGHLVGMQGIGKEDDEAEEAGQAGGGAGDSRGRPLALCLKAEVGAQFLEGDLHVPAQQVEAQDLRGARSGVGAEEGEGPPPLLRITHQHPPQGQGSLPGAMPQGGAGGDLYLLVVPSVPGHRHRLPQGLRVQQAGGQTELARPLLGLGTTFARRWGHRRVVEGGIQAQAGDESHPLAAAGVTQADCREAAIAHQEDRALGLPAPHQADQHARALDRRAMALTQRGTGRGSQRGHAQERAGPGSPTPGHWHQQHHAQPLHPWTGHHVGAA